MMNLEPRAHWHQKIRITLSIGFLFFYFGMSTAGAQVNIANAPLFLSTNVAPLTMITMGRDHTLYYEAYNDASDLNGDGVLNVGYDPDKVDYFGYFDSWLCYTYNASGEFVPAQGTANKKCTGGGQWSGDFLNYITTSRIDALRKVLYGGMRAIDTPTRTVLERAYIPQDAHSWGKEYESIERDGYDIGDYTPLGLPEPGTRHLFANTTLLKPDVLAPNRLMDMKPLMRVLNDSRFRIWEWVAIERHVAGSRCIDGGNNNNPCVYATTTQTFPNHPQNHAQFLQLFEQYGTDAQKCGSGPIDGGNINTSGSNNNPFTESAHCGHDFYFTAIEGTIYIPVDGTYRFATNGDDGVEFLIGPPMSGNEPAFPGDFAVVSHWYGGHGQRSGTATEIAGDIQGQALGNNGSVDLSTGWYAFRFHHEERTGGDNWQLLWEGPGQSWQVVPAASLRGPSGDSGTAPTITTWSQQRSLPASNMTDYVVRVEVCDPAHIDPNRPASCRRYPGTAGTPSFKPAGLLHQYGEDDSMLFGLLTGSFTHPHNMRGGVLRKNVESFMDEVNPVTGQFTGAEGIVTALDRFRIVDFDATDNFVYRGGWLNSTTMADSSQQFPDWGNPIAEMMYEAVRYFLGDDREATPAFVPGLTGGNERVTLRHYIGSSTMDLPVATWQDPYDREDLATYWCSPAANLVVSDVNPNYDTQYLPGTAFSGGASDDLSGGGRPSLNVSAEANAIWNQVYGASGLHFIGETTTDADSTPSPKTVTSFNIRGLSPNEPTKRGGYYAGSVARYAFENDLREDLQDTQRIHTFAVALASPLPRIELPVGGQIVTVVPYAISTGNGGSSWINRSPPFMPTNTIVDFFVERFANTDPQGSDSDPSVNGGRPLVRFRINYEDVEQGADHDMDAIVLYELRANADDTVTISLVSEYAAGSYTHNMGYVISGTTADGVYLEVRDIDGNSYTAPQATPPGVATGGCMGTGVPAACSQPLPYVASRTFTPGTGGSATVLRDPLWYAALVGSENPDPLPAGGDPENYFLVTNASNLQAQLEQAFERIMLLAETSSTAAATSSAVLQTDTLLYAAEFRPTDWSGTVKAREVDPNNGEPGAVLWDAEQKMNSMAPASRNIFTLRDDDGTAVPLLWDDLGAAQQTALEVNPSAAPATATGADRVNWLRGIEHTDLRDRSGGGIIRRIGDLVNSDPQFMFKRDFGYSLLDGDEGTEYKDFRDLASYKNRPDVLFVGSNGGMLHAFHGGTPFIEDPPDSDNWIMDPAGGDELFAYVPSELLLPGSNGTHAQINELMEPDYDHRYFVDGTAAVSDAYLGEGAVKAWKSVLVGTMGAGGRTVFALDVTDPGAFDETNVLWEFGYADADCTPGVTACREVGYGITQPTIARLSTGTWVAIFGNGHNSAGHKAQLFMVNLANGELESVIEAVVDPEAVPPEDTAVAPNGLGPAVVTDWPNSDLSATRAYAGDLKGNLWRFDLSAATANRLFSAVDASVPPVAQPITARPSVAARPGNSQQIVVAFGTGSFFRVGDDNMTGPQVQSLYGIFDSVAGTVGTTRADLTTQTMTANGVSETLTGTDENGGPIETTYEAGELRFLTSNTVGATRGWVVDLPASGERVISEATFPSGTPQQRVRFTSLIPDPDPCGTGRDGFLMDFALASGGSPSASVFDLSRDGEVDTGDEVDSAVVIGIGGTTGERITSIRNANRPLDHLYDGSGQQVVESLNQAGPIGRQSWRQLR